MQRIDHPSAVTVRGKKRFTAGDPISGVQATVLTDTWANTIQEELANLLEKSGVTLDARQDDQIYQLMRRYFGRSLQAAGAADFCAAIEGSQGDYVASAQTPAGLVVADAYGGLFLCRGGGWGLVSATASPGTPVADRWGALHYDDGTRTLRHARVINETTLVVDQWTVSFASGLSTAIPIISELDPAEVRLCTETLYVPSGALIEGVFMGGWFVAHDALVVAYAPLKADSLAIKIEAVFLNGDGTVARKTIGASSVSVAAPFSGGLSGTPLADLRRLFACQIDADVDSGSGVLKCRIACPATNSDGDRLRLVRCQIDPAKQTASSSSTDLAIDACASHVNDTACDLGVAFAASSMGQILYSPYRSDRLFCMPAHGTLGTQALDLGSDALPIIDAVADGDAFLLLCAADDRFRVIRVTCDSQGEATIARHADLIVPNLGQRAKATAERLVASSPHGAARLIAHDKWIALYLLGTCVSTGAAASGEWTARSTPYLTRILGTDDAGRVVAQDIEGFVRVSQSI